MEGTPAGDTGKMSGGSSSSVTEGERHHYETVSETDAQSVERHIAERSEHGEERSVERHGRGRREAADPCREETARSGYERAWHALSGYERAPSPTSMYDGAPHPISGYERLPVDRAHTMKDFEKQITDLKKENFNLKLRIYFLEEQVQRQYETSSDELHRMNIELKVEVESLKHDFQEKHNLLVRASKAMEGLTREHDLAVQRLQEEHLQRLQDMEVAHSHAVHLLDNQIQHEKAELEKMCVLLDQERMQRFTAEERLLTVNEQYTKTMKILEDRDWIIQCLNETVHSKDALIAQLEKQIASMMKSEVSSDQKNTSNLHRGESEGLLEAPKPTCNGDKVDGEEENVNEWQRKVKEMDNLINELQQKLEANKAGFAAEEKNSIKRDKAIQGLTLALKKKTKENDKLRNEIDNLNVALAKAREVAQEVQLQSVKENVHPDYKKLIFTLQAEQDVYSRLLKYEREAGGLQKEREAIATLRRWLEENIQANQELRKIMEAQIMAKYKGDDSMSFLGDQTSYLSICLDHLDQNDYYFAGGLHGRGVSKNIDILMEEAGTQTQSDVSALAGESSNYKSDLPLNERSTVKGKSGGNDGTPTKNGQHTVSSATQTDPGASIRKSIAVNVNSFPEDNTELIWTLQDGELNLPSPRLPQKPSSSPCEIQRPKQGEVYNLSPNAKKSRLPVLVKSSLNTKPKTDITLTPAKENDHSPEELQIENRLKKFRCDEMEVEAYKENRDLNEKAILDRNYPGPGQRDRPAEKEEDTDLMGAESEITTLKENGEVVRCQESELHNPKQRESTERAFKELQAENYRMSEELTRAQKEIETLKANEDLKREVPVPDISSSNKVHMESVDEDLQAENDRLPEQLKLAQMEIKTLKANENAVKHKDPLQDVSSSNHPHVESMDLALQKELNVESHSLSEQVEKAKMKMESNKGGEELWRCKSSELDLNGSTDEERKSPEQTLQKDLQVENCPRSAQPRRAEVETLTANDEEREDMGAVPRLGCSFTDRMEFTDQTLQKELRAENLQLSEQLRAAQMEIVKLKADAALISRKNIVPDTSAFKVQVESTDQASHRELQAENHRLSEQLKQAQKKIEKLQEERSSTGGSIDSLKLHGSDADDDLSEQSFLDKTITNAANVNEVDATSDFGEEVCRPHVDSQNAVALRCHHDNHCAECANNRGILSLPTSASKRASTIHPSPQFSKVSSGKSFEDTTSLSKYNLLVQSQARELSLQRQKIKESHNLSVICSKNFYNILKTFENLIPASTLDSNITLGFQEQITQTVEWLKDLEYKLSDALYGEEDAYSDHSVDSLLHTPSRLVPGHRMWADKHGCHVLGLVEDYNALRKQILEARNVLQEMESLIDHGVETAVLNMTEHFGNIFFEKLTKTKQSLEDAGCLMKLLWRVSLPVQIHSPYNMNQDEEANLEVTRLRKRVLEQEKLLSGMVKRVYSENQMKEDIEKLILNQLAMTHDILKRAKGNLEVQVVDKPH